MVNEEMQNMFKKIKEENKAKFEEILRKLDEGNKKNEEFGDLKQQLNKEYLEELNKDKSRIESEESSISIKKGKFLANLIIFYTCFIHLINFILTNNYTCNNAFF